MKRVYPIREPRTELVTVARLISARVSIYTDQFPSQRFLMRCLLVAAIADRSLFGLVCLGCHRGIIARSSSTLLVPVTILFQPTADQSILASHLELDDPKSASSC